MKRDVDDFDLTGLERRLRLMPAGHSPAAPKALHQFIETVPAMRQRPRIAARLMDSLWLRRGGFALAAAAAVVIAIVVSALVVGIRSPQTNGPAARGGWTWQKADGTVVGSIFPVGHGYIGICESAVVPADSLEQLQQLFAGGGTLCTSPDGTKWTMPPDPSIVRAPADFHPTGIAHAGQTYVATALPAGGGNMTVWYSRDGVSWQRADQSQFGGLSITLVAGLNGRVFALAADPAGTGAAFVSTNGADWMRVSTLPVTPGWLSADGTRILIGGMDAGQEWVSWDGLQWNRVAIPDSVTFLSGIQAVPGGFIAVGASASSPAMQLLRSTNGVDWHADQGDLNGSIIGLSVIGDRLVASVLDGIAPSDITSTWLPADLRLWQSSDGGRTWQPLLGPDGKQLAGIGVHIGDRLGVEVPDAQNHRHLEWVGTAPSAPPTPSPSADTGNGGPSLTPAETVFASGAEPSDFCSRRPAWFPALQTNLFGLSDWHEVAAYFGGDTYGCGFGGPGLGSHLAVIGMCDSPQTIQIIIGSQDGKGGQTPLAGFTVDCPTAASGPQVVYRLDNVLAALQGDTVDIQAPFTPAGPYKGRYAFLVESAP